MYNAKALKLSNPINKVLAERGYEPLKVMRGGQDLLYKSPLHDDTEASLSVRLDKGYGVWYDRTLKRGGDVIDLIAEMDGVTKGEAIESLLPEPEVMGMDEDPAETGMPAAGPDDEGEWEFEI